MKRLIRIKLEKHWRYASLSLKGSGCWLEWRLAVGCGGTWDRFCVREDGSKCSASHINIAFLWWNANLMLWI